MDVRNFILRITSYTYLNIILEDLTTERFLKYEFYCQKLAVQVFFDMHDGRGLRFVFNADTLEVNLMSYCLFEN